MQQPRIWLVEDEQSIADTLVYPLQQEGFQVTVFGRGLPALEAAAHQAPDVAILDVGLPDISGFEREVCARVRTVLRRLQKFAAPSPVVRVGEFVLDEQAASISWFGQPLNLTRYEFLLLKTLLHAPGRVFSRQQLMELVWSDAWESLDRTVDTHIKTLRAKLRAVNPEVTPINTHRGMGYSLGRG